MKTSVQIQLFFITAFRAHHRAGFASASVQPPQLHTQANFLMTRSLFDVSNELYSRQIGLFDIIISLLSATQYHNSDGDPD
jgi:hypothetical protein